MEMNWYAVIVSAFVPLVVGFLWYNPMLFAKKWMKESGVSEEKLKNGNSMVIFGLSFVFSFLLAFIIRTLVIHQLSLESLVMDNPEINAKSGPIYEAYNTLKTSLSGAFRTFKHGILHGFVASLFIVLPIIATNGLFERKSWTYIFINWGYWTVTLMIMGGILCGWV